MALHGLAVALDPAPRAVGPPEPVLDPVAVRPAAAHRLDGRLEPGAILRVDSVAPGGILAGRLPRAGPEDRNRPRRAGRRTGPRVDLPGPELGRPDGEPEARLTLPQRRLGRAPLRHVL